MRDKRQCGRLTQEQLYLLDIAGFDATVKEAAGGESNRTWEMWFDELVEYKSVVGSCEVPENRVGRRFGAVGAEAAGEARGGHAVREGCSRASAGARRLFRGVRVLGGRRIAERPIGEDEVDAKERERGGDARLRAVERGDEEAVVDDDAVFVAVSLARASRRWIARINLDGRFFKSVPEGAPSSPSRRSGQSSPCGWRTCETARRPSARRTRRGIKNKACPRRSAGAPRSAASLENFSPVWLGELERFASLRAHRVTLHDPAHAAFVRRERAFAAANAGRCSRARLMRLRRVGMSGVAGALLLDDCELRGVDECLSADALAQSGPYDGSDGGTAAKTVAALPAARETRSRATFGARGARGGKEEASAGDRPGELRVKPSARARARPRRCRSARGGEDPEAPKAGGRGERKARLFGRAVRARCVAGPRGAGDVVAEQMRAGKAVCVD